jgi:glycosyltransferase involved in cell wall biosynthesis
MTKISIVIPVFNARARIGETLESVRSQTYPLDQLETIIVDDGSSDQCVRIARTFLHRHGMRGTVLVTDGNHGTSASLNRGWQAAAGDWIQFLDSDDLLAPNKLEIQISQVPQLPDVVCSSWQRFALDRQAAYDNTGKLVSTSTAVTTTPDQGFTATFPDTFTTKTVTYEVKK